MTKKLFTTKEMAELLGLCQQRITAKIRQGHFPNARPCECGRSIMIPESDLFKGIKDGRKKK